MDACRIEVSAYDLRAIELYLTLSLRAFYRFDSEDNALTFSLEGSKYEYPMYHILN
jgi:hypothetical protein